MQASPPPIDNPQLSELINHEAGGEFIETIKVRFKNIRGKGLKLLLMALQNTTPPLLPKERIAKKFHECCDREFDWDVASYNAMNGYQYNSMVDDAEYNDILETLQTQINSE